MEFIHWIMWAIGEIGFIAWIFTIPLAIVFRIKSNQQIDPLVKIRYRRKALWCVLVPLFFILVSAVWLLAGPSPKVSIN